MTEKKSRRGCLIFAVVAGCMLLLASVGLLIVVGLVMAAPTGLAGNSSGGIDEFPEYESTWTYGEGDTIAVHISVHGVIAHERIGGFLGPSRDKISEILRRIRAARNDEDVRAIILDVDSPGGVITPCDEIYHELKRFKDAAPGRTIVVIMKGLAASGGYYVAAIGDYLLAEPTCMIGSIGVILQTINWADFSERYGITDTTIKSGENKDLLNPFEPVRPEEVDILQSMIDHLFQHFVGIVRDNRDLDPDKIEMLTDGRVFSAPEALAHNLIDGIGYWEDAVQRTADLCGVENVTVVRYDEPAGLWSLLGSVRSPAEEIRSLLPDQTPRFMYLWRP